MNITGCALWQACRTGRDACLVIIRQQKNPIERHGNGIPSEKLYSQSYHIHCSCNVGHFSAALLQNASVSSTVLPVKNTEAPALASRLQSVLQDFGISAQVTADRTTNSLIVNGSSNAHKIAADLLRTLDKPIAKQVAQPQQAGSKVIGYSVPLNQIADVSQKIQAAFANQQEVKVVPDARTGQIVVIAGDTVHRQITQYLDTINPAPQTNVRPVSGPTKQAGHQLLSIDSRQFEASVQSMFGGNLRVTTNQDGSVANIVVPSRSGNGAVLQVNRATNTISVQGNTVAQRAWLKIANLLDTPATGENDRTGIVPVEKADPNTVNRAVTLVEDAEKAANNTNRALQKSPSERHGAVI